MSGPITKTRVAAAKTESARVRASVTPRQQEVWKRIAEGRITKEIADEMKVSLRTVEKMRSDLYARLPARNTADLVRLAVRHGVIVVEVIP